MRCIFRDNIPLAQMVLRIILNKPDLIVETLETQADFKRLVGGRSIILDVYATDSEHKKYNIEVQRADSGADKHRARYHSSAMDIENLRAGQKFEELPEAYTIFITENDVFGNGAAIHRIERVDMDSEGKPLFGDGEHILYVNGAYRGDSDIGRLMHDFCCDNPDKMYFDLIRTSAKYYKEDKKGVSTMSSVSEQIRYEKAIWIASALIKEGSLSLEKIAECCDLPLAVVEALANDKSA